ncbi:hypothetical protein L4Q41_006629 [Pseudomonas aeruginosa]|nr:hypothetical protein [Pseudomonas aeruginosa]
MDGEQWFFRATALAASPAGHGAGQPATWGRIFADLIRAGHCRESLDHYTGRQLILYWKEAQAAERREQAREVRAVMFGMTGGKEATAFLNELES